jgi:hypothetical protein
MLQDLDQDDIQLVHKGGLLPEQGLISGEPARAEWVSIMSNKCNHTRRCKCRVVSLRERLAQLSIRS